MIPSACPGCGAKFHLKDEFAGKNARCPNCKQVFTVGEAPPPISFDVREAGPYVSVPKPSESERGSFGEHVFGIKQKKISFVTERYFVRDKDNRDVWYAIREIKIFKSLLALMLGAIAYAVVTGIGAFFVSGLIDTADAAEFETGAAVSTGSTGSGTAVRRPVRRVTRANTETGAVVSTGSAIASSGSVTPFSESTIPASERAIAPSGTESANTGANRYAPASEGLMKTPSDSSVFDSRTESAAEMPIGSPSPSEDRIRTSEETEKIPKEIEDISNALKNAPKNSPDSTGTKKTEVEEPAPVASAIVGILALLAGTAATMAVFPKRHIRFYENDAFDASTPPEANILQLSRFEFPKMRYRMDDKDGAHLATFEKNVFTNVFRRKWLIVLPDGRKFLVKEDSILLSLLRRFMPFGNFIRTNFAFYDLQADPEQKRMVGIFKRKFELFDNYLLDLSNDPAFGIPRKVAIGLSILLDTGEKR